jgi:hypothetical protein
VLKFATFVTPTRAAPDAYALLVLLCDILIGLAALTRFTF